MYNEEQVVLHLDFLVRQLHVKLLIVDTTGADNRLLVLVTCRIIIVIIILKK
jgi:hypothetical protein